MLAIAARRWIATAAREAELQGEDFAAAADPAKHGIAPDDPKAHDSHSVNITKLADQMAAS